MALARRSSLVKVDYVSGQNDPVLVDNCDFYARRLSLFFFCSFYQDCLAKRLCYKNVASYGY